MAGRIENHFSHKMPQTPSSLAANTSTTTNGPAPPATAVPAGPPLSKNEIVTLLQSGVPATRVEQFVEVRGVTFAITPEVAREIMAAGGTRSLIGAITEKATSEPAIDAFGPSADVATRTGPDYDDLTDQATAAVQANNANGAIRLLQQAISLDPSQPTAYTLLGFAELYGNKNIGAAEAPMRAAVERGGAAVFRVYHDHTGSFGSFCQGSFFVAKGNVSFKADDGRDTFEADDASIKEVKTNSFVGAGYGAFHVKLDKASGGRNYNFAPATQQKAESQLIITLIQAYP